MALDLEAGSVPTGHRLRAALVAACAHLPTPLLTWDEAPQAYGRIATDAVYAVQDLIRGQEILELAGLLTVGDDGILRTTDDYALVASLPVDEACDELLARYLKATRPLWLVAAVAEDEVAWELVPDREKSVLTTLIPDFERREAFLLACGQKVDKERDKRTGDLAEEHVVALCRSELAGNGRADLAAKVVQVSLISDGLGYDVVAPRMDETRRRLEVKGTRSQGPGFKITLSRGEARQGLRDADWYLVVCQVKPDDSVNLLGWCSAKKIEPDLPIDGEHGRWSSVEIQIQDTTLTPGLPPC